jgi:hypothetical protein
MYSELPKRTFVKKEKPPFGLTVFKVRLNRLREAIQLGSVSHLLFVCTQGPIFRAFFFHGKSLSAELSSVFLGKKIFENFSRRKFFPDNFFLGGEGMYEKSALAYILRLM